MNRREFLKSAGVGALAAATVGLPSLAPPLGAASPYRADAAFLYADELADTLRTTLQPLSKFRALCDLEQPGGISRTKSAISYRVRSVT